MKKNEPAGITFEKEYYVTQLTNAFVWYNYEAEKKDARLYLRNYVVAKFGRDTGKGFDRIPDSKIITTYGWMARLHANGNILSTRHLTDLDKYIADILLYIPEAPVKEETEAVERPSVRDYMQDKISEYLGELEHSLDCFIVEDKEFDLRRDMKSRAIPAAYTPYIEEWVKKKAEEYIMVYNSTDDYIKESYRHCGKRKLTQIIKLFSAWLEDLTAYSQFKKANRKPRAKKIKPAGVQVAKLKYKREDAELGLKSVLPSEIVGASQVWIYNTKYKKLAVYRTDSSTGIQVKGTTLQNYEPEQCEQKALRKPAEVLKKVLDAGKISLRRIISELSTKESPVNGRINEDCIILRVIR